MGCACSHSAGDVSSGAEGIHTSAIQTSATRQPSDAEVKYVLQDKENDGAINPISGRTKVSSIDSSSFLPNAVPPLEDEGVLTDSAQLPVLNDVKAMGCLDQPFGDAIVRLLPFQADCLRQQVIEVKKGYRQIEGAVAFIDISGFSALAHVLGQSAKGAMILSQCINEYLAQLIAVVNEHCGDIVTFAGDAFIALWQSHEKTTQRATFLRAIQCSLILQQKYNMYSVPGTNVVLRIHVGVAYGFFSGLAMVSSNRGLFLLTGRPMISIGDAVNAAEAGQVCVTGALWQLANGHLQGKKLENGTYLVERITTTPIPEYSQPRVLKWDPDAHQTLEEYLPFMLLDHMRRAGCANQSSAVLALQRFVAVLFLGQPELQYNDPERVQQFATAALDIVTEQEGEVLQVIQDDKGLHLIAVFGLQVMETPAAGAVQSAINMLSNHYVNGNHQCRIGISTGNVFCGIVGSKQRSAFDVLGDAVNLSCRLMQLCKDTQSSFLCDEATQTNCHGRFLFRKLTQQYHVKGQSEKITVFNVQGSPECENLGLDMLRRRLQAHSTTVCGRHQERAMIDSAIRELLTQSDLSPCPSALENVETMLPRMNSMSPKRISSMGPTQSDVYGGDTDGEEDGDIQDLCTTPRSVRSMCSDSSSSTPRLVKKPYFRVFSQISRADSFVAGGGGAGSPSTSRRTSGVPGAFNQVTSTILSNEETMRVPMMVFEGVLGMGKSTMAVDMQNQWPLLPIIVVTSNEHDRRPLATFQRVFSSLIAWIRLYPAACNITNVSSDEEIIRALLPTTDPRKLALLDHVLFTRFDRHSTAHRSSPSPSLTPSKIHSMGGDVPSGRRESLPSPRRTSSLRHPSPLHSPKNSVRILDLDENTGLALDSTIRAVASQPSLPQAPLIGSGGIGLGTPRQSLGEHDFRIIISLMRQMVQSFCAHVRAMVICYDDAHHMDSQSQDVVEQLHTWVLDSQPAFLQVLFVESGCVGVLPNGAVRQELRDLTIQDIREFLRVAFGERVVDNDMISDSLCHLIARKVSYNPSMMAELSKLIAEPRIVKHIRTNARGEVVVGPSAMAEVLDYDFSRSHKITQMVSHTFDGMDAPQQIIAKAASVVLAHPGARLYRPELYCLVREFNHTMVDKYLDWLVARRIIVVDSSGQSLTDEWRTMTRYKFSLECFGTVLTSLMSPNTLRDMNKRLATFLLELKLNPTAVNTDVFSHYLMQGDLQMEAATQMISAIETYTDDDLMDTTDLFATADIHRAHKLTTALASLIEKVNDKSQTGQIAKRLAKAKERIDKRLNSGSQARLLNLTTDIKAMQMNSESGITDLDASARRLIMLLSRLEELCEIRKSVNFPLWQQFQHILQGYQRIQAQVVDSMVATTSEASTLLKLSEITSAVKRVESSSYPANLTELRGLTTVLITSIETATKRGKQLIAKPLDDDSFLWKDCYAISIPTIDHQHKQLFTIMKRFATAARMIADGGGTTPRQDTKQPDLGKLLKWLLEYVLFHFLAEEVLMRRVAYPQYKQHQFIHQAFTQNCLNIQSQFNEGTLTLNESLVAGLRQWLIIHIGNTDRHFGGYYRVTVTNEVDDMGDTPRMDD